MAGRTVRTRNSLQFFDDFSGFEEGRIAHSSDGISQPSDYYLTLTGSSWYIDAVVDDTVIGGQYLTFDRATAGSEQIRLGRRDFSIATDSDNWLEVVTKFRVADTTTPSSGVKLELLESSANYGVTIFDGGLSLFEYSTSWSTSENIDVGGSASVDISSWMWQRIKVQNNVIYCKIWQDGDPEPEDWQVSGDSPSTPLEGNLYPLLSAFNYASCPFDYDVFGIGINASAPKSYAELKTVPSTSVTIIEKPWTKQPPADVMVNRSHPLVSYSLRLLWSERDRMGIPPDYDGATRSTGPSGKGVNTTGTAGDQIRWNYTGAGSKGDIDHSGPEGFTFFCLVDRFAKAGTDYGRPFGRTANDGAAVPYINWDFEFNNVGAFNTVSVNINTSSGASGEPVTLSDTAKEVMLVGVIPAGTGARPVTLYINGEWAGASPGDAGPTAFTTDSDIMIGSHNDTGSQDINANVVLCGAIQREWSENEIRSFSSNPWQIFEPRKILMPPKTKKKVVVF